ncbi:MAG TPA: hypothetical protein VM821_01760, partial [Abditibacteriaceae bacterium]|nr:hypothetical protein [Abditibacteriaceae bacterium]
MTLQTFPASLSAMPKTRAPHKETARSTTPRWRPNRKTLSWGFSLGFLASLCAIAIIGETSKVQPFVWTDKTSAFSLPPSIRIYEGAATAENGEPIKAWYADVDYNDLG